jgi:hypothetical protein
MLSSARFSVTAARIAALTPHYVLGRFHVVRGAYSQIQRARQTFAPPRSALQLNDKYVDKYYPISVAPSGLVENQADAQSHACSISRDSYSAGISLTTEAIESLVRVASSLPLKEQGKPLPCLSGLSDEIRANTAIATVTGAAGTDIVQRIAGDETIVSAAAAYLRYVPRKASSWLFWSFKNELTSAHRESVYQTIKFHYDVHWYNFFYLNFYLLDTNARSGAHVLIRGSHRDKHVRHLLGTSKLSDEQASRDYGANRIQTLEGPAGSGFFEDSSCYHKALAPLDRDRLMLQIRYQ